MEDQEPQFVWPVLFNVSNMGVTIRSLHSHQHSSQGYSAANLLCTIILEEVKYSYVF
jgi:uncharacterized membrane protein